MKPNNTQKRRPKRLITGFVGVSLVIHLFIFMHLTDLYRSNRFTCIELTLKDITKPFTRDIPRPRPRPRRPKPSIDPYRLKVSPRKLLHFEPTTFSPFEADLPKSLVGQDCMPDAPDVPGVHISEWDPQNMINAEDEVMTDRSYLEMVRMRIESRKKYPKVARVTHREGRVTIHFTILSDGNVKSVKVLRSSRHEVLDQAALKALKDACPFPRPPATLYKGEVPLEITIVFELT
ncbi:MAG: energy transducer TonB [Thermodesulfobacteriota bacterium]|nr:energy transducer TonB [Thermodesulfobacteriota bacterium]